MIAIKEWWKPRKQDDSLFSGLVVAKKSQNPEDKQLHYPNPWVPYPETCKGYPNPCHSLVMLIFGVGALLGKGTETLKPVERVGAHPCHVG